MNRWKMLLCALACAGLSRTSAYALELAHVYEDGGVLLYEGAKAGLKEGQVLNIQRDGQVVGQIQIDEVSSFTAKGHALEGEITQGDSVALDNSGITETPAPFNTAGRAPMPSADDPALGKIATGGMKRMDEPEPVLRKYSLEETDSPAGDIISALPLDVPGVSGALDKPTVVAMADAAGKLLGGGLGGEKPKSKGAAGSLGLVTRPSAVVYKSHGGLVGLRYGFTKDGGSSRKVYYGRFAPSEKFELHAESTSWDTNRDNVTRFGGKAIVKTMSSGSQIALYGDSASGDTGNTEYGLVGTMSNPGGRFTLGAYLSDGGVEAIRNGRRVQLGEDYGLFIGFERDLALGLSVALEYDTMAAIEGAGYAAELRWKRGSNYTLTGSVSDTDGYRDATLGAFFSF